jgi:thioredoxin-related protein
MLARWYLFSVLALLVTDGWAALREGELNPDLTNPGSVEFPHWFKNTFMDIKEDVAEASEAGKRVLLFFYQDGCPYCKKLVEYNFTQRDIVTKAQDTLDVIAVNMWGDREVTWVDGSVMTEKEFAKKMRVMFTPTLLFLNEEGGVVLRVNGYYHPTKFKTALNYVASHREKKERFADYYNRLSPPPSKGELNQQPFFKPIAGLSQPASSSSGYKLVLFEQKQCPNCDELHQDIFKRKESLEQLQRFDVYQVDMWSKEKLTTPGGEQLTPREWAEQLDIKFAPSMVFFNKQGKEAFRTEAYLKAFHIQSVLDYVASGAYLKEPEFQRYIDTRAEHLREQGVTIKLMQ